MVILFLVALRFKLLVVELLVRPLSFAVKLFQTWVRNDDYTQRR